MFNLLDYADCIETPAKIKKDLKAIELILASRFNIKSNVRRKLISLCRSGKIDEDEQVGLWLSLYSAYKN